MSPQRGRRPELGDVQDRQAAWHVGNQSALAPVPLTGDLANRDQRRAERDLNTTGYVAEIAAPYTGAITQIANGIAAPKKLLVDGAGDLFVMTNTGYVLEYAPPYTGTPVTIGNGVALSSMVLTP